MDEPIVIPAGDWVIVKSKDSTESFELSEWKAQSMVMPLTKILEMQWNLEPTKTYELHYEPELFP